MGAEASTREAGSMAQGPMIPAPKTSPHSSRRRNSQWVSSTRPSGPRRAASSSAAAARASQIQRRAACRRSRSSSARRAGSGCPARDSASASTMPAANQGKYAAGWICGLTPSG